MKESLGVKRIITYLYEYNNGIKGANEGFIKLDLHKDNCRMQLHIRPMLQTQEHGDIYLVLKNETSKEIGLFLGTTDSKNASKHPPSQKDIRRTGNGLEWIFSKIHVQEQVYTMEQIEGVGILYRNGIYRASSWVDEPQEGFLYGTFDKFGTSQAPTPDLSTPIKETTSILTETSTPIEETTNVLPETSAPIEKSAAVTTEKSTATEEIMEEIHKKDTEFPQIERKKISFSDIHKLPQKNWYLCNNSFVIHGFFNYRYLMLKEVNYPEYTKCYLGVPGIYERPERTMAMLFGFPTFEAKDENYIEDILEGTFGYWYCLLDT